MAEAVLARDWNVERITAGSSVGVGEIWQLANGQAAIYERISGSSSNPAVAATSGQAVQFVTAGKFTVPLTANITILDGGRVYWDHSAGAAHFKKVNDRDFYLGTAVGDSTGTQVLVDLNKQPCYDIDLLRDGALIVPVGTQAIGGFGFPKILGGSQSIEMTATNEAQKIDLLSVDGFAKGANAIIEFIFRIPDDGAGTAADFNVGVANGTHATDANSITERVLFHTDANALDILAWSTDGTTTVALTDTTVNYAEGSAVANRVECWIDMRNPAACKLYIDGVQILPATVFNVDVAAGPFFLLVHLEKTSSTDVYRAVIDRACARFAEQ